MPRIALCVIARDEAQFIGGCLASASSAVDQIIVVDTGSTDETASIARQHGAKVVNHRWNDHFAEARNAALSHVQADWILLLDADERLASGAGPLVRAAAASNEFDCGLMPLHNASSITASEADILIGKSRIGEPSLLPRLLRFTTDLRWEGAIHETVTSWLRNKGRRVGEVSAPIVHFGAIPSVRERLGKDARNLRLLELRCTEDPTDHIGLTYLAREHIRVGQVDRARAEIDKAWSCRLKSLDNSAPIIPIATIRAHLMLQAGDAEGALDTMESTERLGVPHPNIPMLIGSALELLATQRPGEATVLLSRAKNSYIKATNFHGQKFADEVLPGATSWVAATRLAVVLMLLGDPESALDVLDRVLKMKPSHSDATMAKIEALLNSGKTKDALTLAHESLTMNTADSWLLAAACCDQLGAPEEAKLFTQKSIERAEDGYRLASHRKPLLTTLCERYNL